VAEVGILVVEDDIVSQRAIKNVLDAEGWRVRILPIASHMLAELSTGTWSLVILNVSLIDLRGPLFSTLKDLAQAEPETAAEVPDANAIPAVGNNGNEPEGGPRKGLRVLFLVPMVGGQKAQAVLEREDLPYTIKPYHLHDFLEKVSELLVEAGAIGEPMRTMGNSFARKKRRIAARVSRDTRRGAMFASREDYQMTEEELADFERQEEEDRKKREKELKDLYHR
jgi:CheY-like chemotaxis protein